MKEKSMHGKQYAGIFAAAALLLTAAAAEERGTHFVPPKGTSNVAVTTVARPGAGCDLGAKVVMDAIARVFDPLARPVEAHALPPPLDAKSYFTDAFCRTTQSGSATAGTCRAPTGIRFPAASARTSRRVRRFGASAPAPNFRFPSRATRRGFS